MKGRMWSRVGRWSRCGHGYCSDCKTRRGRNLGNRRDRRRIKRVLTVAKDTP